MGASLPSGLLKVVMNDRNDASKSRWSICCALFCLFLRACVCVIGLVCIGLFRRSVCPEFFCVLLCTWESRVRGYNAAHVRPVRRTRLGVIKNKSQKHLVAFVALFFNFCPFPLWSVSDSLCTVWSLSFLLLSFSAVVCLRLSFCPLWTLRVFLVFPSTVVCIRWSPYTLNSSCYFTPSLGSTTPSSYVRLSPPFTVI